LGCNRSGGIICSAVHFKGYKEGVNPGYYDLRGSGCLSVNQPIPVSRGCIPSLIPIVQYSAEGE
jgi:hypothetical protein